MAACSPCGNSASTAPLQAHSRAPKASSVAHATARSCRPHRLPEQETPQFSCELAYAVKALLSCYQPMHKVEEMGRSSQHATCGSCDVRGLPAWDRFRAAEGADSSASAAAADACSDAPTSAGRSLCLKLSRWLPSPASAVPTTAREDLLAVANIPREAQCSFHKWRSHRRISPSSLARMAIQLLWWATSAC